MTQFAEWIRIPVPLAQPRWRLVCLPHAGGGASTYYRWAKIFARLGIEVCAVQYPGREDRIDQPVCGSTEDVIDAIATAWPEVVKRCRGALFGHSMGGALAFNIAAVVQQRQLTLPPVLFISARNPFHRAHKFEPVDHLPDAEFIQALREQRDLHIPEEIAADPEMMQLVTATLKADFRILDRFYTPPSELRINVPLVVFGEDRDRWTDAQSLSEWEKYTSRWCEVVMIAGGHMFHQTSAETLASAVNSRLWHLQPISPLI